MADHAAGQAEAATGKTAPARGGVRPPSERQLAFARKLEKEKKKLEFERKMGRYY